MLYKSIKARKHGHIHNHNHNNEAWGDTHNGTHLTYHKKVDAPIINTA